MKNRMAPRRAMLAVTPDQILRPVVGLDIDGTLGEYHEHFRAYAMGFLQRYVPKWDGRGPYWRTFGVTKLKYREMKLGYRQGRLKRSMPVLSGAAELSRRVRAAGAEVWVCTTRPYLRLDNIDPDTQFWLRHNGIQFDGMLFGETKWRDLVRMVGRDRVLAVLDDEPEQIGKALRAGVPTYLFDRPYNQHGCLSREHEGAVIVTDLDFATTEFVRLCQKWRSAHRV